MPFTTNEASQPTNYQKSNPPQTVRVVTLCYHWTCEWKIETEIISPLGTNKIYPQRRRYACTMIKIQNNSFEQSSLIEV